MYCLFFFFNDTATTEIYTLPLHDALPISRRPEEIRVVVLVRSNQLAVRRHDVDGHDLLGRIAPAAEAVPHTPLEQEAAETDRRASAAAEEEAALAEICIELGALDRRRDADAA